MQGNTTILTLTNANTDYSFSVPPNTLKLTFKARTAVDIKYTFGATGQIAAGNYMTVPASAVVGIDGHLIAQTIFFQSATAGAIVEIETILNS